jgi:hypothetical protein
MIKINKLIYFFALSTIFSIEAGYHSRQLDVTNDSEVSGAAKVFFYKNSRVYSHTYYTTHYRWVPHKTYTSTTSRSSSGEKTSSESVHTDWRRELYQESHDVYRSMNEQECAAEMARARSEVLNLYNQRKNIFVCISDRENMICGFLLAEHGNRQADLAEYKKVYVYSAFNADSYFVMHSMTQFAEKFYKDLSMNGIAIDLASQDSSFYTENGYVLLSRGEMVSKNLASSTSCIFTTMLFAALSSAAGYYYADERIKEAAAVIGGLTSLLIVPAVYDYMNNTVYYKAL